MLVQLSTLADAYADAYADDTLTLSPTLPTSPAYGLSDDGGFASKATLQLTLELPWDISTGQVHRHGLQ